MLAKTLSQKDRCWTSFGPCQVNSSGLIAVRWADIGDSLFVFWFLKGGIRYLSGIPELAVLCCKDCVYSKLGLNR